MENGELRIMVTRGARSFSILNFQLDLLADMLERTLLQAGYLRL